MNWEQALSVRRDALELARIYRAWDRRLRTHSCGRLCVRGDTLVRHAAKCDAEDTDEQERVDEALHQEELKQFGERYRSLMQTLGDGGEPTAAAAVEIHTALNDLEAASDQFLATLGGLAEESIVGAELQTFDAELLRLQYEVAP